MTDDNQAAENRAITSAEEADAFAKENLRRPHNQVPVVAGEAKTLDGSYIRFWQVLWQDITKPGSQPDVLIGASQFIADNGKLIQISSVSALGGTSKTVPTFKDSFLKQYWS